MTWPSNSPMNLWGPGKMPSFPKNVLTFLLECGYWYSVCIKYKNTRAHIQTHHVLIQIEVQASRFGEWAVLGLLGNLSTALSIMSFPFNCFDQKCELDLASQIQKAHLMQCLDYLKKGFGVWLKQMWTWFLSSVLLADLHWQSVNVKLNPKTCAKPEALQPFFSHFIFIFACQLWLHCTCLCISKTSGHLFLKLFLQQASLFFFFLFVSSIFSSAVLIQSLLFHLFIHSSLPIPFLLF